MGSQHALTQEVAWNTWWTLQSIGMSASDLQRRMSEISRHVWPRDSYGRKREGISMDVVRKILAGEGSLCWHSRCVLCEALDRLPNGLEATWLNLSKVHDDAPYPAAARLREKRLREAFEARRRAHIIALHTSAPNPPVVA